MLVSCLPLDLSIQYVLGTCESYKLLQIFSDKIRQKQEQEIDKHSKSTSKSLSAIEEFCEKFDQSVRKTYIKVSSKGENSCGGRVQYFQ